MATVSLDERRRQAAELVAEISSLKISISSILEEANVLIGNIKSNDKG